MALLYINKVKDNRDAFEAKVRDISQRLGINPNWLMLLMSVESGLSSSIENSIGCVGLIQFCPDASGGRTKTIGNEVVNLDTIKGLSNVDQLEYVYRYFQSYSGRIKSFEDLYLITFFPIALGWDDNRVIESSSLSSGTIAAANPLFDVNKDLRITVGEFKAAIRKKIPLGYQSEFGRTVMAIAQPITDSPFVVSGIVILFLILIYLLYTRYKN